MLAAVQTHWLDVCEYFTQVQCAGTEDEEAQLAADLPMVREHLSVILDALVAEKQILEDDQRARVLAYEEAGGCGMGRRKRSTVSMSMTSSSLAHTPAAVSTDRLGTPTGAAEASQLSMDMRSSTDIMSTPYTTATHGPFEELASLPGAPRSLPPCYHYLFGVPPDEGEDGADGVIGAMVTPAKFISRGSEQTPMQAEGPRVTDISSVFPDTVGPTFFLTLCLYAKHDQPPGSRTVVLEFLQELIRKADLPPLASRLPFAAEAGSVTPVEDAFPASPPRPRSLLQLSLSSSIVPLLDMIRKVGAQLDPMHHRPHGGGRPGPEYKRADGDADRTAFVRFLCALAERMEQVPDLANYFVTTHPKPMPYAGNPNAPAAAIQNGEEVAEERLVLLDILLPYMTHDCTAPEWEHRRDTCRYALSAVLSLAKCPDPWVQDLVGKEAGIADRTLAAACTTLLTLCKVPDNDDSEVQLLYLRDVLRFWSALCLTAPSVARELGIADMVERDFAQTALVSLFMSPNSRVFAGACLVTASVLEDLNSAAPVVSSAIARAVLAGVVDADTGRRQQKGKWADLYECVRSGRLHRSSGADGASYGSFLAYYILSHLSTRPTQTEDELVSQSIAEVQLSVWTTMEAALVLLKSLAENCPYHFVKYALYADMREVARLREAAGEAAALGSLTASNSAPRINLDECFPPSLRVAEAEAESSDAASATGDEAMTVCGVSAAQLGEEVFECMLRMETNVPAEMIYERQRAVSGLRLLPTPAESREHSRCSEGTPASASVAEDGHSHREAVADAWFHAPTAGAPLTGALSELLGHFTELPFRTALLLTQLCVRVAVMPDLRVHYTLLDPVRGPFVAALRQNRQHIEERMAEAEVYAVASAAAAAAVSKTPPRDDSAVSGRRSSSRDSSHTVPPTPCTLAYLYRLYLTCWQHLPAHVFSSILDTRDTRGLEALLTPSSASSTVALAGTLSDDVIKALVRHQSFLEACASLEQFRMELDAAVGYMALSHNLMTLRV